MHVEAVFFYFSSEPIRVAECFCAVAVLVASGDVL